MPQSSISRLFPEDINLNDLFEILSPQNNLVLADDMMLSDANGTILQVSETYEKNFGFTHGSIVGKSAFDLEADGTFFPCITAEIIRAKKKITTTQTINHTHTNVMTVGIPLFDGAGNLKYAVCFNTVSQRWLPETIARLRAEYPHVRVSVVSESPLVINNWMKDGSVELAVTNRAWTSKELGWVSVFKDLFRGVFPTGSIKGDSVPLERFSGEAVIMPDYGQNVDVPRIFKKHHIDVAYTDDRMGNRSVLAAVAAGLGVTIMPQLELDYYAVQNVVTLPLEPRQYREMGVATPRGGQPDPIAQEFVRYLKQVVKKIEKPPVNPEEA